MSSSSAATMIMTAPGKARDEVECDAAAVRYTRRNDVRAIGPRLGERKIEQRARVVDLVIHFGSDELGAFMS